MKAIGHGGFAPEEEIVGIGREAAVLEQAEQVVELAVDVANQLQRSLELKQRRLVGKLGDGLVDEEVDVVGRESDIGSRFFCGAQPSAACGKDGQLLLKIKKRRN